MGNSAVTNDSDGNGEKIIESNNQPASANSNDAGWPSAAVQHSKPWSDCNSKITEYLSSNNQPVVATEAATAAAWATAQWGRQRWQQQNKKYKQQSSSMELVALLTAAQHSNDNSKNNIITWRKQQATGSDRSSGAPSVALRNSAGQCIQHPGNANASSMLV